MTSRFLAVTATALRAVERAVWPMTCAFCGRRHDMAVCEGCLADLPWIHDPPGGNYSPLTTVYAPLEYEFPIDAAIKMMKFRRKLFYAPAFGQVLANAIRELPDDVDSLLPTPLHWRRHAIRGFNQAVEIARPIRMLTGLPFVDGIARSRSTPYQSGLTAAQRKRNLASAFVASTDIDRRHVLIIDDVITTGETCRQLAKVVLEAGAGKVSALAIARVVRD